MGMISVESSEKGLYSNLQNNPLEITLTAYHTSPTFLYGYIHKYGSPRVHNISIPI